MKVILTGDLGFIGTHLSRELTATGHEVVGVDIKRKRRQDLRFPANVAAIFDAHADAHVCVHLAAKVGRLFGEDSPMETVTDNVGMTALVAQACGERGIRLAYASTSEVYGDNGLLEVDEFDGPFTRPHNLYGITKGMGEEVCEHYAPTGLVHFRFSMPYGPGLPAGRGRAALINMLHQALHRRPIIVHRGAERSWCWVGDTVRGARMILESELDGPWNVGRDDQPIDMLTMAQRACEHMGAPYSLIEEVDAPARQTVVKRLSTERLRALGWRPEVDLLEGVLRTVDWVKALDEDGNPTAAAEAAM